MCPLAQRGLRLWSIHPKCQCPNKGVRIWGKTYPFIYGSTVFHWVSCQGYVLTIQWLEYFNWVPNGATLCVKCNQIYLMTTILRIIFILLDFFYYKWPNFGIFFFHLEWTIEFTNALESTGIKGGSYIFTLLLDVNV